MAKRKATKKAAKKSTTKKSAKKSAKKTSKKSSKKTAKRAAKKATRKAAGPKKKRTLNPALRAPYTLSAQLSAVIGGSAMPRQEVVSKIWKYIKKNGLQDRQTINSDDKLKPIFGNKKSVTMFEMQKHLSKHLRKTT